MVTSYGHAIRLMSRGRNAIVPVARIVGTAYPQVNRWVAPQASPCRFQSVMVRATMTLPNVAVPTILITGPSPPSPPET